MSRVEEAPPASSVAQAAQFAGDPDSFAPSQAAVTTEAGALRDALRGIRRPLHVALRDGRVCVLDDAPASDGAAFVPPCPLENLGDPSFRKDYGISYPYVGGSMANGISSVELVEAMARAGMLAFFGAAGLTVEEIESAIDRLAANLVDVPHGFNLIHTPNETGHEEAVVDLYLRRGIRLVEASAFLDLTLPLVRYRVHGIHRKPDGAVEAPNRVIGKVSRIEVATKFFSPPPEKYLRELVKRGDITEAQAQMASEIPMAQDLTAEADSGGHTDNRPAIALLPTMLALRDNMRAKWSFEQPLRVGGAGGLATPSSALALFSLGAAYVVAGSVNQACVESGASDRVREMLAQAEQPDIAMAPAADMFEMGVKVQVLKRGTMFPMRAGKLYELYRSHAGLDQLPAADRGTLEKSFFKASIDEIWKQTREFFQQRDPVQIQRAEKDPKHKMALVFRWYLGMSSRWANAGEPTRQMDYQVWCGPAMGAFNEWVRGSFLEKPENRKAAVVGLNLLYGAAVLTRANTLRFQGIPLAPEATRVKPLEMDQLQGLIE